MILFVNSLCHTALHFDMIELLYTLLIMNVLLGGGNQINHVYRYVMSNLWQGWKCIADVLLSCPRP